MDGGKSKTDMRLEQLKTSKILIVDDKEANIDILAGLLEMQGYSNVISVMDPQRVMELFHSFQPDLILLDIMMPYLDGYQVMDLLKEFIPETTYLPILVLTADISPETRQKALASGAKDFLSKPFDLVEVGYRIRNLLETRLLYCELENEKLNLQEKVKERTSELEKSNTDLVLSKEKAEAGDRLKSSFLHVISHEIRTPLTGILGMYEILTDPELSREEKEEYLSVLQESSDRLIKTVTDYLDIAMIVSNNVVVSLAGTDVHRELTTIADQFREVCHLKGLQLNLLIPSGNENRNILTDPLVFRKGLFHLMDNAVKFTKQGSIGLGYSIIEESIEFFVKDTGIGIGNEIMERIFQPFVQEDVNFNRGHEGNGLGLAIVNGFVKALGGELRIESVQNEGTVVRFSLQLQY